MTQANPFQTGSRAAFTAPPEFAARTTCVPTAAVQLLHQPGMCMTGPSSIPVMLQSISLTLYALLAATTAKVQETLPGMSYASCLSLTDPSRAFTTPNWKPPKAVKYTAHTATHTHTHACTHAHRGVLPALQGRYKQTRSEICSYDSVPAVAYFSAAAVPSCMFCLSGEVRQEMANKPGSEHILTRNAPTGSKRRAASAAARSIAKPLMHWGPASFHSASHCKSVQGSYCMAVCGS